MGVLAIRHEASFGSPFPYGRIFYLYGKEVLYKDVGPQDVGFITSITAEGRVVNLMGDGGDFSYTLFELTDGRVVGGSILFGGTIDGTNNAYYYIEWLDGARQSSKSATQDEFSALLRRYGVSNRRGVWWDMDDATDEILSLIMTFD